MFSLESFHKEYETESNDVIVNGRKFKILLPRYLSKFIKTDDVFRDFPLWAKIWQASWVLAGHLDTMPVDTGKNFLEIGAGVGLVSIVAASSGHRITMTEFSRDALQFARANAHINGCSHLPIRALDWRDASPNRCHPNLSHNQLSFYLMNHNRHCTTFYNVRFQVLWGQ